MKEIIKINKKKLLNIIYFFNFLYNNKNNFFLIHKKLKKIEFIYSNENTEISIFLKIKNTVKKKYFFDFRNFQNVIKNINKKIIKINIKKNFIIKDEKKIKYFIISKKIKKKKFFKNKNIKSFFILRFKNFNLIYDLFNNIEKNQKENSKNFNIIIYKNTVKFIITDNYQLCYYLFKQEDLFFEKKRTMFLENKILKIINELIKKNKELKIKIYKKLLFINIKKIKIISKLLENNFIIIKNFKKNFKYYVILKTNDVKNILNKMFTLIKKNKILKILIERDLLKIMTENEDNKIFKNIKVNYKWKEIAFLIDGKIFLNFLKNLKSFDFILNFSKKKRLVITIPKLKGFKYFINVTSFN